MKKLTIFLITCFLTFSALTAQVRVSGEVRDTRGRIIDGVSITLKGTYDGSISDSTGHFSFKTFEKGDFVLQAKIMGYKTVEQGIAINKENINIHFSLKE